MLGVFSKHLRIDTKVVNCFQKLMYAFFLNRFNPLLPKSDIDFTLFNPRRFYSPKGDPLGFKGLNK